MAITIECGQKIRLVATGIDGSADVNFPKPGTPGGLTQANAETQAKTDAEKNAKANAEADITRQQNEINCEGAGETCKKDAPAPTSTAKKSSANSTFNADRSGIAHGKAKADGKGHVECKRV